MRSLVLTKTHFKTLGDLGSCPGPPSAPESRKFVPPIVSSVPPETGPAVGSTSFTVAFGLYWNAKLALENVCPSKEISTETIIGRVMGWVSVGEVHTNISAERISTSLVTVIPNWQAGIGAALQYFLSQPTPGDCKHLSPARLIGLYLE